jgi:hypothetical protein
MSSIRIGQQLLSASAVLLAGALLWSGPARADTYGRLLVRGSAAPAGPFEAHFERARPPRTFVLVVTEPRPEQLSFSWSVRCIGSGPKESGGASGRANVGSGHWVKRIRADWIRHPVSCSGTIAGSAAASPVLARIFIA